MVKNTVLWIFSEFFESMCAPERSLKLSKDCWNHRNVTAKPYQKFLRCTLTTKILYQFMVICGKIIHLSEFFRIFGANVMTWWGVYQPFHCDQRHKKPGRGYYTFPGHMRRSKSEPKNSCFLACFPDFARKSWKKAKNIWQVAFYSSWKIKMIMLFCFQKYLKMACF